ncbi:hypothetical protein NUSPORA_01700 [Nucleospora cyclopteri]
MYFISPMLLNLLKFIYTSTLVDYANANNMLFFEFTLLNDFSLYFKINLVDVHTLMLGIEDLYLLYTSDSGDIEQTDNLFNYTVNAELEGPGQNAQTTSYDGLQDTTNFLRDFVALPDDLIVLYALLVLIDNKEYETGIFKDKLTEAGGLTEDQIPQYFKTKDNFTREEAIYYEKQINIFSIDLDKLFKRILSCKTRVTYEFKQFLLFTTKKVNNLPVKVCTQPFEVRKNVITDLLEFRLCETNQKVSNYIDPYYADDRIPKDDTPPPDRKPDDDAHEDPSTSDEVDKSKLPVPLFNESQKKTVQILSIFIAFGIILIILLFLILNNLIKTQKLNKIIV